MRVFVGFFCAVVMSVAGLAAMPVRAAALATPSLALSFNPTSVRAGNLVDGTVTVSGAGGTGTASLELQDFGNDSTCTNSIDENDVTAAVRNGAHDLQQVSILAGPNYFRAIYLADADNESVQTGCQGPGTMVAGTVLPTFSLTPSTETLSAPGLPFHITAHLSGTYAPSATAFLRFYLPAYPDCAGPPDLNQSVPVTADGDLVSEDYLPPAAGLYHVQALFVGDAYNETTVTDCLPVAVGVPLPGGTGNQAPSSPPPAPAKHCKKHQKLKRGKCVKKKKRKR